jgi:hypothetical protein
MIQKLDNQRSGNDHDFPLMKGFKLIPSCTLICNAVGKELKREKLACFLRCQLFDGSTSRSHHHDLNELICNPETKDLLCGPDGKVKPVFCRSVDGGPDQNPRHLKNITVHIVFFIEHDLDLITIRCYAPGQSCNNMVERSMCSLSSPLAGVILPPFTHGEHIRNGKLVTGMEQVCKDNVKAAAGKWR